MLVYGDRSRSADPRAELTALQAQGAAVERRPAGLERHAALVATLIACGELAQGLADAAFDACGEDAPDAAADLALEATRALADAVVRSWREGFGAAPVDGCALSRLADLPLPERVTLKEGEGYAFYAVYPEAYAEAALQLAPPGPTVVVGLRSIGTSLAGMVAAAVGAGALATVRPTGPPFEREVRVSPRLAARLLIPPEARIVVVDEGPGLSGSSFGAALDWAQAQGASPERLAALPSHPGDLGPKASKAHRKRWSAMERPHVSFDALIAPRLAEWVADLTGPPTAPLQDLSGGAWRALRHRSEGDWPAVNAAQERRKFLLRSERGAFLPKFAGLGRIGERKLQRAQRLAAAGFTVAPLGLRHGFLVEPWIEPAAGDLLRGELLASAADYLRFRAHAFPAEPGAGADVNALFEMLQANAVEALGPDLAEPVERWRPELEALQAQVRRVVTDNRLHPHEWIAAGEGRLFKTDALDHAEAHDLVGAQDIAWDVAGAAVEFDLDDEAGDRLWREVGAGDRPDGFLSFHRLAYLAFQLGACTMAVQAHAGWPEEAARLATARDRYAEGLRRRLSA